MRETTRSGDSIALRHGVARWIKPALRGRFCRAALAVAACAGMSACDATQQPTSAATTAQSPPPATAPQTAEAGDAPPTTAAKESLADAPADADEPKRANRLAKEKSPYLLQHAHNPVDWFPWGPEAFAKAKKENKPIFLSVGYSTCRWCHVMEREAFSDEGIAKVLNEQFVPIKVDREERPDVDRLYMTFVTASTGSGGWPMTVFLTPDLKPVLGGTYFPIEDKPGQRGLKPVLERVSTMWTDDPKQFTDVGDKIAAQLQEFTKVKPDPAAVVEQALLAKAYASYVERFDAKHGGFRQGPQSATKFPSPVELNFLLHHYHRSGEANARDMVLKTLAGMAVGGIRDHLGGGFHRYSTDARWFLPHFEKMLYDQAQIAGVYLDAYQVTGDAGYADVAREIFEYVLRDLTSPEGAFYSAEDAESVVDPAKPEDKAEGAFYVWTMAEIERALGKASAAVFAFHYGVAAGGNVEPDADPHQEFTGKNILAAAHTVKETAEKFGKPEPDITQALADGREKLLAARAKHPRPYLDDKTIVAWNGLMISALARGGPILNEPRYTEAAAKAAAFVRDKLYDPESHELSRIYRQGPADVAGFLEDYAFYIESLVDLYEATLDVQWLKLALHLQGTQDKLFGDPDAGGYFSSGSGDANLLVRMKDDTDNVEPSGNSVAARNLLRLGQMTGDQALLDQAERTIRLYAGNLQKSPAAMPRMLVAMDFHLDKKPKQIVLAGDPAAADMGEMLHVVFRPFLPNRIILGADGGPGAAFLGGDHELVANKPMIGGKPTAYVCENGVCDLPTNDLAKLGRQLAPARAAAGPAVTTPAAQP